MSSYTFTNNNQLYNVHSGYTNGGLFRQNAMTVYQGVSDYLIVAQDLTTKDELFYLVLCKKQNENFLDWVQVSLDIGKNIHNSLSNTNDDDDDDKMKID